MQPTPADDVRATFARYHAELLAFAAGRLPAGAHAEDLLQEVWAAFTHAGAVEPIGQPRAWLYRALRNRITDAHRRRAARPPLSPIESVATHAEAHRSDVEDALAGALDLDAAGDEHFWGDIEDALAALPPLQREVFERNVLDGETLREIATDLGVPLRTAISRKRYARRRLRDLLSDPYGQNFQPT